LWVLAAALAPVLAPGDPLAQTGPRLQPPSTGYLLGTDELGRDVLSRVLWGARITIPYSLLLVLCSVIVGGVVGLTAGYLGGWVDAVLMRVTDMFFAFPAVILAMATAAALGASLTNAVVAVVVVAWPVYARLVRGLVLGQRSMDYVKASRLLGAGPVRVASVEVLPNIAGPLIVMATLELATAVLLLSALSFLGLGAQPPTAEWGAMISAGARYFDRWWLSLYPGLAILSLVVSINFIGDALRDSLDPTAGRVEVV
jgi:peptide/nickel transport system permease protein